MFIRTWLGISTSTPAGGVLRTVKRGCWRVVCLGAVASGAAFIIAEEDGLAHGVCGAGAVSSSHGGGTPSCSRAGPPVTAAGERRSEEVNMHAGGAYRPGGNGMRCLVCSSTAMMSAV